MEPELVAWLKADAGIALVVGDRVEAPPAPEGTAVPFLTYQLISQRQERTLNGFANQFVVRYQFDAYARTRAEVSAIMAALFARLDSMNGDMNGVTVEDSYQTNRSSMYDEESLLHRESVDYMIRYNVS